MNEFEDISLTSFIDGDILDVHLEDIHGIYSDSTGAGVIELRGNHPVLRASESKEEICRMVEEFGANNIIGCETN